MFNFNMNIKENFASFRDSENENMIFVDSFDNQTFDVRFGTIEKSSPLGEIKVSTTEELNKKLQELTKDL